MALDWLLNSILGLLALGFVVGIVVGATITRQKLGCTLLLAVPVAMFAYVWWQQGQHPESLRSTSSLDFLFGPLWPSLGAAAGFFGGATLRSLFQDRS